MAARRAAAARRFHPVSARRSVGPAIDWGELAPLRIRAREVAEGVYAGAHRSARRGAGVEFGGYREYLPGDDLRWLDRRSLLRHDRLVVRQFETETDRSLALVVDASASMGFRGPRAPGAKLAFSAVLAGALARVALASGDPASLAFLGAGGRDAPAPRAGGREQFDRIVAALEAVQASGDASADPSMVERVMTRVARDTRRGAVLVVLSDLLDLPDGSAARISELASRGRILVVVQVLDPAELELPFDGTVRLRALEGGAVVETDAATAREPYRRALAALRERWRSAVVGRGGRFLPVTTTDPPVAVVRQVVESVRSGESTPSC
ncbi:MAG: DUF58 domain-containing protein [Myxococcales bacterium]|nr:DUF58 domain-containing protein [Myxococcales bacterium]